MPDDLHHSGDGFDTSADTGSPKETTEIPVPRIAVLPFANASADPDQDYFGEGIAAEILICLTRVPGFHLVARSSVFALNRDDFGDDIMMAEIGLQLSATAVLHGTVSMCGRN